MLITSCCSSGPRRHNLPGAFCWGRAIAFLVGSSSRLRWVLSACDWPRLATSAWPRPPDRFGQALQLGYRTGTITGMLTDGLGLLGGSVIFLIFGEHAYEALLGFGFGGTLLALFMHVGGGIYAKAADVGAGLVGKVEAESPRTTRRTRRPSPTTWATTSATAQASEADIFESYEVTIVAAMILGIASFGHKGVIFHLLFLPSA